MATQQAAPTAPVVALVPPQFGLPQGSLDLLAPDTTNQLPVTLGATTQVSQQLAALQNTDVIANWSLQLGLSVTAPVNSTTASDVVLSPYAPLSAIQNITLNIQNVFQTLNTSGVDLAIRNALWPYRKTQKLTDNVDPNSVAYPSDVVALQFGSGGYSDSSGITYNDYLDLGPAFHFDHYFDVDLTTGYARSVNGVVSQRIYAGAQYLGGTTRQIIPSVTFSPILGSNINSSLYTGTATTNGSGTATLTVWREGWFSNTNLAMMPAITNWIPVFNTSFITIGASTSWVYELPKSMQVLGLVFRFFDPSSNSPMSISNVETMQLKVGSGIVLMNTNGVGLQKRLYSQHGQSAVNLPAGTVAIDRSLAHDGMHTNANAINTYTTNGAVADFKLSTAGSSQFGCYVSVFGLQYVQQGSGL